jgi:hypothetical protein
MLDSLTSTGRLDFETSKVARRKKKATAASRRPKLRPTRDSVLDQGKFQITHVSSDCRPNRDLSHRSLDRKYAMTVVTFQGSLAILYK